MEKCVNHPHISINQKNLQNFDLNFFASLAQVIKLLVWLPKFIKAYIYWHNGWMDAFNLNQNEQFENATIQILQIFQRISGKSYGKNCYLDNFAFLSPSHSEQCWGIMCCNRGDTVQNVDWSIQQKMKYLLSANTTLNKKRMLEEAYVQTNRVTPNFSYKNYGKISYLDNFVFLSPYPS